MPPEGTLEIKNKCSNTNKNTTNTSLNTSIIEGKELGELKKLWKDIAGSEERLKLMSELKNRKIGFNEIEMFNLGLEYDLKSEKLRKTTNKPTEKVTEAVMNLKIRDEAQHHREMNRRRDKLRRWLKNRHEHKHYKYKMLIKELRTEAERTRREMAEKYRKKLKHLEEKYQEKETEERIPTDMEQLKDLRIFRQEKFEEIETEEIEIPIIGEVELTENEKKVLKRTPKFAIPERLLEHTLKEDIWRRPTARSEWN